MPGTYCLLSYPERRGKTPARCYNEAMSWYHPSTLLDKIFEGGIVIKGVGGVLEVLGGFLLLFISPHSIHDFIVFITQRDRIEDPHDMVTTTLLGWTDHLAHGGRVFIIAYLWVHAATKLIAVIGILRNQLWAYPFSLITLGMMMLYQTYSIILHPGIGMILLTVFDVFMLWLIWREYGKARQTLQVPVLESAVGTEVVLED